jgi:hypothetical protein
MAWCLVKRRDNFAFLPLPTNIPNTKGKKLTSTVDRRYHKYYAERRVSENRVLRRIFGPKREEGVGG